MRLSSHLHTTFSLQAQQSSRQLFSFKVSRALPSVLLPSSWDSCKFVQESCCCNSQSLRKTCPMLQSSRVILTRCEKWPSRKNRRLSQKRTPFGGPLLLSAGSPCLGRGWSKRRPAACAKKN